MLQQYRTHLYIQKYIFNASTSFAFQACFLLDPEGVREQQVTFILNTTEMETDFGY